MLTCSDLIKGNKKPKMINPEQKKFGVFCFILVFLLSLWSSLIYGKNIIEMLGSQVTPLALGARELAGSNPAISTE